MFDFQESKSHYEGYLKNLSEKDLKDFISVVEIETETKLRIVSNIDVNKVRTKNSSTGKLSVIPKYGGFTILSQLLFLECSRSSRNWNKYHASTVQGIPSNQKFGTTKSCGCQAEGHIKVIDVFSSTSCKKKVDSIFEFKIPKASKHTKFCRGNLQKWVLRRYILKLNSITKLFSLNSDII